MPVNTEQNTDQRRISRQAAEWIVSLSADDTAQCAQAYAGFEAWKRADPRHAEAARRMETMLAQLDAHDRRPARAALAHASHAPRKRRIASAVATLVLAVAVLATVTGLGVPLDQPSILFADMRTGVGVWQTRVLADGSKITLSSSSAIDVHISGSQRVVQLLQGEVMVDVAHDAARPFYVRTDDGSIRALGTRFTVERHAHATDLSMLESKTEVRPAAPSSAAAIVAAGEKVRITQTGVVPLTHINADCVSDAWRDHQLVVQNRPLSEVLDQLARHHRGVIRYNQQQIAGLHVSAVLPLDDTQRALQLLLNSFPTLRIRTMTSYVVLVDAPSA